MEEMQTKDTYDSILYSLNKVVKATWKTVSYYKVEHSHPLQAVIPQERYP